jgi:hypothetical protein
MSELSSFRDEFIAGCGAGDGRGARIVFADPLSLTDVLAGSILTQAIQGWK